MQGRTGETYAPAEDTFFLEDRLRGLRGMRALDMGTGSGYLARSLAGSFQIVVGTDVNLGALLGQGKRTGFEVCCQGADALSCNFDLIVCNPPYLATEEILDIATDGGPGGIPVPLEMIRSALPLLSGDGRLLFVTSSLSDLEGLIARVEGLGARARVVRRKRLFFEELVLVEVRQDPLPPQKP